jgi:hypothetical membrane protein
MASSSDGGTTGTTDPSLRRLALAGVVGPIVWWLLVVVNAALTPGYSHVADFISTLGAVGAPNAALQQVNCFIFGGGIAAFAVGLHRWFDDGRRPRVGTLLLAEVALGIVLSGPFQSNPAAPESTTNVLHDLFGSIASLAAIVAIPLVSRRLDADDGWPRYRLETVWTAVVAVGTFAVFIATIDSPYVGLTQRLFVGTVSLWVAGQTYRLYRLADGGRSL